MDKIDEQISLCTDCAKHPSLRNFVESHAAHNIKCGVCHRNDPNRTVCDIAHIGELSGLIRALIRFYYDESDYNHHWGGDDIEHVLLRENEILATKEVSDLLGEEDDFYPFFEMTLFSPTYPDPDHGISIYAGHDEFGRGLLHSIKDWWHPQLREYNSRLAKENYFLLEPEVRRYFERFAEYIETKIEENTISYRARIGVAAHFSVQTQGKFYREIQHQPFSGSAIGAPPPRLARAGRLNRDGVSFLYLSSSEITAASEVRPHPGHLLSIASFRCIKDLRVADFNVDISKFTASEYALDLYHLIYSVDRLMSTPMAPEQAGRYSITQLFAEVVR